MKKLLTTLAVGTILGGTAVADNNISFIEVDEKAPTDSVVVAGAENFPNAFVGAQEYYIDIGELVGFHSSKFDGVYDNNLSIIDPHMVSRPDLFFQFGQVKSNSDELSNGNTGDGRWYNLGAMLGQNFPEQVTVDTTSQTAYSSLDNLDNRTNDALRNIVEIDSFYRSIEAKLDSLDAIDDSLSTDCYTRIDNIDQTAPLDSVRVDTEFLDDPCCGAYSAARRHFVDQGVMDSWLESRPDLKFQWAGNDQWYNLELSPLYNVAGVDTVLVPGEESQTDYDTLLLSLGSRNIELSDSLNLERSKSQLYSTKLNNSLNLGEDLVSLAIDQDVIIDSLENIDGLPGWLPDQINVLAGSNGVYGVGKDWNAGNNVYGVSAFGRFGGLEEGVDRTLLDAEEILGIGRRETIDRTEWKDTPSIGLLGKVGYKNNGVTLYAGPGVVIMRKNNATSRGIEHYNTEDEWLGDSFDPATAGSESKLGFAYWAGIDFDLGDRWSLGACYLGSPEFTSVGLTLGCDIK
jgi:opacity protein-like surface antigen